MKTLIIHPQDRTTTFLQPIYQTIPDKTIISGGAFMKDIRKMIDAHERVMMMGHGSPHGLLSVGRFYDAFGYVIDGSMAARLSEKNGNVFIWCNADQYVNKHNLKGFFTGMFISEVGEALYCGLKGIGQEQIDESNDAFTGIVSKYINEPADTIYNKLLQEYGALAKRNPVAMYNYQRLYYN
jgi:hypothetical protein